MEKDLRRRDKFKNSGKAKAKGKMSEGKKESRKYKDATTNKLIEVWGDTYKLCKNQFSDSKSAGVLIDLEELLESSSSDDELVSVSKATSSIGMSEEEIEKITPKVDCCSQDTLEMATDYYFDNQSDDKSPKILILNMASNAVPGGGVTKGKTAQEEEIFRRTNAFMGHPTSFYPLDDLEVVYMDQAYIIKDTQNNLLKTPVPISIISCPAIRHPKLYRNQYKEADRDLMEAKIQGIFEVALQNDIDYIVLGALGCGVYANPKEEVAEIFAKTIIQYYNRGPKIGFAILDKSARDCDAKGRSNKQIFADTFKEYGIRVNS